MSSTEFVRSFVPGHVTGLFRIMDGPEDPLQRGSVGGGFSVEMGTLTTVALEHRNETTIDVFYNGTPIDAPVTRMVVKRMLDESGSEHVHVTVRHESALQIGAGLGASGAGALGTALSLGEALGQHMTVNDAARHAHSAEVLNRTGLGDVIGQVVGGVEVRLKPGAPGIGQAVRLEYPRDMHVVLAAASGIETKAVLSDQDKRKRINESGGRLVADLHRSPSFETLIAKSREFTEATGLSAPRVRKALKLLYDAGFEDSSMVMLGDSVFCFCDDGSVPRVIDLLCRLWPRSEVHDTHIAEVGGRVLR
ncbi:MAG: GHMP kinase [Candidatus Thorarchaeota archaeon]|nr:GHMP kinase [Candidatus Thorarchaeota archaeon]